jgi:hypothetical protein
MINHSIIIFIIGWVLWFIIDKQAASLGTIVPREFDNLLNNFQLAFDMLQAGYLKASYVFIWKAHYIVLSLIAGLMSSMIFQAVSIVLRRRKLHQVMWPEKLTSDKADSDQSPEH